MSELACSAGEHPGTTVSVRVARGSWRAGGPGHRRAGRHPVRGPSRPLRRAAGARPARLPAVGQSVGRAGAGEEDAAAGHLGGDLLRPGVCLSHSSGPSRPVRPADAGSLRFVSTAAGGMDGILYASHLETGGRVLVEASGQAGR